MASVKLFLYVNGEFYKVNASTGMGQWVVAGTIEHVAASIEAVRSDPRPGQPNANAEAGTAHVRYYHRVELTRLLQDASDRLIDDILRQRFVPVELPGFANGCIVTDQASFAAAIAGGRRIAGWTRQPDLAQALQSVAADRLVDNAGNELSRAMPQFSAKRQLTVAQKMFAVAGLQVLMAGVWFVPEITLGVITVTCAVLFLSVAAVRAASLFNSPPATTRCGRDLRDDELPAYSVIVPLFREVAVLGQLVAALKAIDYPDAKLDIKLVLEQEDFATRRHIAAMDLPAHFELLIVPRTTPQTKPKALNYALQFARGELVGIYDAEDIPDPDQLRKAANVFSANPHSLACLQARLAFYNPNENWLTRQFAIEYAALFDLLVPMLAHSRLPIPLGGTSNHFRTDVLRRVGGWDAHNVTEDADLGLRLARFGWRVGVIGSTTHEEANCRLDNWVSQRARWLKGWMQTWLVHMRSPIRLCRELGVWPFIVAQIMMLGMIVTALLHPLFLGFAIWATATGSAFDAPGDALSSILTGLGVVVLFAGYGFAIAAGAKGLLNRGLAGLLVSLAGMPVYWLLTSVGGWLALWQLIVNPHHWNKTAHGLTRHLR